MRNTQTGEGEGERRRGVRREKGAKERAVTWWEMATTMRRRKKNQKPFSADRFPCPPFVCLSFTDCSTKKNCELRSHGFCIVGIVGDGGRDGGPLGGRGSSLWSSCTVLAARGNILPQKPESLENVKGQRTPTHRGPGFLFSQVGNWGWRQSPPPHCWAGPRWCLLLGFGIKSGQLPQTPRNPQIIF